MALFGQKAYDKAQQRLGIYAAAVNGKAIRAEADDAALDLLAAYPCIGSYQGLTLTDQLQFDRAVGVTVALNLVKTARVKANDGFVTFTDAAQQKVQFDTIDDEQLDSWQKEITQAIGFISCVRAARLQRAARFPGLLITPGNTEAQRAFFASPALTNELRQDCGKTVRYNGELEEEV